MVPCQAGWLDVSTANVLSNHTQVRACGCTCRPARLQRAWYPPAITHGSSTGVLEHGAQRCA